MVNGGEVVLGRALLQPSHCSKHCDSRLTCIDLIGHDQLAAPSQFLLSPHALQVSADGCEGSQCQGTLLLHADGQLQLTKPALQTRR